MPPTEKAPDGIKAWWTAENTRSLDGLPGLEQAHDAPLAVKNSYDRSAPRLLPLAEPVVMAAQPSVKFFDGRLLVAFSFGIATTLTVLRLTNLHVR